MTTDRHSAPTAYANAGQPPEQTADRLAADRITDVQFAPGIELDAGRNPLVEAESAIEDGFQNRLRPQSLGEYIGQETVKHHLSIAISAALKRAEPLDHVLLHGPPGLGKTSLAAVVASELGVGFRTTSGPVLEKPGDLAAILSGLETGDVLFIDEIHRMNRVVEEILYPAMEDFSVDIIVGAGPSARSVKLPIRQFTLIGATTRSGLLSAPLRDRFGIVERFDFYEAGALQKIVLRSAQILGLQLDADGAEEIARRSRGTPRIANRLLKRVRDFAEHHNHPAVSRAVADAALSALQVDSLGLDRMDRLILRTVIDKFDGGPVGVETLAAALSEDKGTLEDVYEPYLIQQGLLQRTPRGREATRLTYEYLQLPLGNRAKSGLQAGLFDPALRDKTGGG